MPLFIRFLLALGMVLLGSLHRGRAEAGALDTLQPGYWYEVPNSKIRTYLPVPIPAGNPVNLVNAWNGGFFDSMRNRYLVMGGGHADYAGNEVYAFSIDTLQWSRTWGPTANAQIPQVMGTYDPYNDGNPGSRHTYGGLAYLANVDRYFVHGGSMWYSGNFSLKTWLLNPTTGIWAQGADRSTCYPGSAVPGAAYDPTTGLLYLQSYNTLCQYNPITNVWTKRGDGGAGFDPGNISTVYDSDRKQFCMIGAGAVRCYDLADPSNSTPLKTLVTTGDKSAETYSSTAADYDPVSKKIVAWIGGSAVYTLDLTTNVWTKVNADAGNTVTPSPPTPNGTFGRWRYVPSKNVFVVVNSIDENVYVYKLSVGGGTTPPTASAPTAPTNLQLAGVIVPPPPPPADTTAPSVPAGLTAQSLSSSQISLAWSASTDNVGVTSYRLFRNGAQIASTSATSYQDLGLLAATTYSFTVAAVDAAGNQSAQSSTASATTQAGSPPPPPPPGQIVLPLRAWVAQGPAYPLTSAKHVQVAYNSTNRQLYLFGGDHRGHAPADSKILDNSFQSGRSEGYAYDVALNKLTLVHNYCQSGLQAGRLDEVGWTYDSKRGKFWMFPGFQWADSNCAAGSTTHVPGKIMTYTPGSGDWQTGPGLWADPSIALNSTAGINGNATHYDSVTDKFYRFVKSTGCGPEALIYDPTLNTWERVSSNGVICDNDSWDDVGSALDVAGRRMFAISAGVEATPNNYLIQYNIDKKTFQKMASPPEQGNVENRPVWDSVNNVLLWPRFVDSECDGAAACQTEVHLHVWSPGTNTWAANVASGILADGTRVKGRHAIFDPGNNALVVFGNLNNLPTPTTFFLLRYGNGG